MDKKDKPPVVYYYMENGLMVFTEAYLLKRGHCCKRSCRHCPYGFRRKIGGLENSDGKEGKDSAIVDDLD